MSDALKLGLAGVGTVGSGLLRLLAARKAELAARAGRPIEVVAVLGQKPAEEARRQSLRTSFRARPRRSRARSRNRRVRRADRRRGGCGEAGGRGRALGRQACRHRQQGAARPSRGEPRRARREEPCRAEFRGRGGRRHSRRQGDAREPARQRHLPRLRHPQRHLQLHPHADGAGGAELRRRVEGGAGARLCRGRPDLRHWRLRHRA